MFTIERSVLRTLVALAAGGALYGFDASAQSYPVKPVRLLFGFAPGGGGDVSARLIAQRLSERLGEPVIVENRAGASGAIADEAVARAPADGHTLLYAAGAIATLPALRANLPYQVERDFAPVSLVVQTAFVMCVHPSVPVKDVKALIALARSQPGRITVGSPGVGSSAHMAAELFSMLAGTKLLHVPYKGAPAAAAAVAAGDIDIAFPSVTAALAPVAAGKLRPLGVSSAKRASLMPALPTLEEAGLAGYERAGWNGVLAPAGVAKDIVARLNAEIVRVVSMREVNDALVKQGFEPQTTTPEEFAAFIRRELAQNARLVKFAGLKAE